MEKRIKKIEGTKEALRELISKREWYKGISVNGIALNASSACQIKLRLEGKSKKNITVDYMEQVLKSAGYKVIQPVIWGKESSNQATY